MPAAKACRRTPFATLKACLALVVLASGGTATAQNAITAEVGVMTDYRVRGLSWSDGEAAAQAYASVPVTTSFSVSVQATTLREAERHSGADAGIDLSAIYADGSGLVSWYAMGVGRFFAGGAGELDYFELQGGVSAGLGPAELGVMASFAPAQDALGGSNFYRRVEGRLGLSGTPVTLTGHIGRSSGSNDGAQSERLRPGGDYTDWALGAEYNFTALSLTLTYSDTDIEQANVWSVTSDHYGAQVVAGAALRF